LVCQKPLVLKNQNKLNSMKNRSRHFLKNCIVVFFCLIPFLAFEQDNWVCEVKPGFKFLKASFFRNTFTESNFSNATFEPSKSRQITKFSFEPELFINFKKPSHKWGFGFGITSYNWDSKTSMVIIESNTSKSIELDLKSRNLQFLATFQRDLNFKKSSKFNHNLVFGLGLNSLNPFNGFTNEFYFQSNQSPDFSQFNSYWGEQLIGSKHFNNLSFAAMVKYELTITSLKERKDLFNVSFSYVQGYSNFNVLRIYYFNSDAKVNLETKSLGSGIRFGISKTLEFEKVTR